MNIYVGNLPLEITREDLLREFMVFGVVVRVRILNDKYIGSGQSRSYGYVEMASISEGQAAINSLAGKIIQGHTINVVESLPLSDKRGMSAQERNNNGVSPPKGTSTRCRII